MQIQTIIEHVKNVRLYEPGTESMWTDPYISKQLLALHIDEGTDTASRNTASIDKTVRWIDAKIGKNARVLDLGCGPGLYTQRLAQLGHRVSGIDFSAESIDYARAQAQKKGLEIEYTCADYTQAEFGSGFDLVMMIYCDFGVLAPEQRRAVMQKASAALAPGGVFILDALNERAISRMNFSRSWEAAEAGFWRPTPYICFSEKRHFPKAKTILDQHIVLDERGRSALYRFWNGYFDAADMRCLAEPAGFVVLKGEQILSGGGEYNDDGVTFFALVKGGEERWIRR